MSALIKFQAASTMQLTSSCQSTKKLLQLQEFSQTMTETLINDLLDLAKLESDHFKLDQAYFNPLATIHNALLMHLDRANEQGLRLGCVLDNPMTLCKVLCIFGDQRRLTQILVNFLNNAFKFTDRGSIKVKLRVSRPSINTKTASSLKTKSSLSFVKTKACRKF